MFTNSKVFEDTNKGKVFPAYMSGPGTAGLTISETHTKINLSANQKGYDNSETTVGKLSAKRIQIFQVYFFVIIF